MWYLRSSQLGRSHLVGQVGVQSEMLPLGIEEHRIGALGFEGILFNILTSAHCVHIILYWMYDRCSIIIDKFSFITHQSPTHHNS